MLNIGCHLSSSKGYLQMGKTALAIGANTFQFFTRNPRGSKAKTMDTADAAALMDFMAENHFAQILAHAPYTLNACSAEEKTRTFAKVIMQDDLARMEYLPNNFYNFHPGSHVGQGTAQGVVMIVDLLNEVMKPEQRTIVLLETMAGKGTEVGRNFAEIQQILERVELQEQIGVCLDTCHIHDAGYDIVHHLDEVIDEFDRVIGLKKLLAIHLNDSMNPAASHKDRHEKIGQGKIGLAAIIQVINHPALRQLPFFLETPNELPGYAAEIADLKKHYRE